MGFIGGIFGALFNELNLRLTKFRHHYINKHWLSIIEVLLVSATTVVIAFLLIFTTTNQCRPIKTQLELNSPTIQLFCPDGQYNTMATIVFSTPEQAVRNLFHSEIGKSMNERKNCTWGDYSRHVQRMEFIDILYGLFSSHLLDIWNCRKFWSVHSMFVNWCLVGSITWHCFVLSISIASESSFVLNRSIVLNMWVSLMFD